MSDFFGRNLLRPGWQLPRLAEVITPDSNGATLDSQGLLTGPIVEVAPGEFRFPLSGGVAKTDPKDGAVILLPWKLSDGRAMDYLPRALGVRLSWPTPGAGSSGLVMAAGWATDLGAVSSQWCAVDWDGANQRPRVGAKGTFGVGAASASGVDVTFKPSFLTGPNNTVSAISTGTTYGTMRSSTEARVSLAAGAAGAFIGSTSTVYLMISLYGSGVLAAMSPVIRVETYSADVPAGELP